MKHVLLRGSEDVVYQNNIFEYHHEEVNDWPKFEVKYAGICASDFNLMDNPKVPSLIMGHEIVCYERALGEKKYYVINNEIHCGHCQYCLENNFSHCENLIELGVNEHGGYAEYIKVPREYLIPINFNNIMLGVLVEPFSCILHAFLRVKKLLFLVQAEPIKIIILGAGVAGKMLAHLLMHSNLNHKLYIYDTNTAATAWFDKNPKISILHTLPNEAFDISIECSGSEDALRQCVTTVRKGGIIFLFGLQHPDKGLPFPTLELIQKELTISSSLAGSGDKVAGKALMQEAIDYIKLHEKFFESILGKVVPLEKLPEIFRNRSLIGGDRTVVKIQ